MPLYHAPTTDFQFLLKDWLGLDAHYEKLGISDFDSELANEIIAQGAKFAIDVVAPLNREGDEEGCKLEDGKITTPKGFADAYQEYVANGWNAMLGTAEYDGQELPYTMAVPVHEMLNAANLSWRLTTMLTESATLAVTKHASKELKDKYLAKLISGEWTGTMNLTEPHAGTDLSLLSTKAEPQGDGSYKVTGNKIFITAGDQDWSSNVIHLVLARLPDAPKGVKGISLFLVPKLMLDENNEPGEPNSLSVGSIEHKMGIKASPTCVMNFDEATGWLVGEENQGLACMFTMMNDARFQVGLQGLGAAEASYQGALTYARERVQSRAPQGIQNPDGKADPIVFQPDVARMLLTQKSQIEGSRALSLLYAKYMDIEKLGTDEEKENADKVLQFLTPICKAYMTDMGLETTSIGVQVFGGHGFIREWGMEQLMRDVRIAMLYEGTNGIQALDLIGRKLTRDGGQMMEATYQAFAQLVADISDAENKGLAQGLLDDWRASSADCLGMDGTTAAAAAADYLAYSAYSLIGVLWYSMADKAASTDNAVLASSKQKTRDFYMQRILPRRNAHKQAYSAGYESTLAVSGSEFDYI
ncbi:alkylation response protein AidB-like acyl-CoA dehydrogenase [Alteromonas sp. 76-1]|jgi:alkylation response protein AidB-like acyl-CoA dehydrogenase|uniref:acyl-CoA dehydrogenase family protein n=1 Tax=Alteromonas sp. 76-1 TaxID=2358187 RepID=UPI000FD16FEA|nr:acyl-CoA dehydrogenase family protein [Alteromonas sp. 76-1]VEL95700.1 alkylation response protein AidB-like acyl-CoA dehydrogenase [Alteromonas sp. 76-1]